MRFRQVLLDTECIYKEVEQELIGKLGDVSTVTPQLLGRPPRDAARIVIDTFDLPTTLDEYLARRDKRLYEVMSKAKIFAGVENLVNTFASAGVKMAIATSTPRDLLKIKCEAHPRFFVHFKDRMVCADDVKIGKPNPEIFLAAARCIGANPANTVVFEDSPAGVKGSRAANFKCIAIANELVSEETYNDAGADAVLTSWTDFNPARLGLDLPAPQG